MALTEVIVLVPEERVGEFYKLVGNFIGGGATEEQEQAPARGRGRRRRAEGQKLASSSRYAPLHEHLKGVSKDRKSYELSFDEIATIMGDKLPQSAYDHRAWWANTESHSQALAWISAGWKVDKVDLENQLIHLVRQR
ncbi:MAG TPA: hypothetical protein VFF08_06150 [Trueperaceae bacterium]|nr:hypothetical protein [Trueperaceae bacterium]